MKYRLHEDGHWDICGENFSLLHAYPAVDGRAVAAVSVTVGDGVITYRMERGTLSLHFYEENDEVRLDTLVSGADGIHDVEPFLDAGICGADHVFIQGSGMGGPSGCRRIGETVLASDGLAALYSEEPAFFVWAEDHRHYVNRYQICEKQDGIFGGRRRCISGGFSLEGTAKGEIPLPSLFFREQPALDAGLRFCAERIAREMGARRTQPPAFHWCSWYYLYQNFSQELLEEYLEGFRAEKDLPFRYVQIDAGYFPSQGDWLVPNHRFPEGLEKAARTIRDAGYEAGVWVGPFMVGDCSGLCREHPDWLLYNLEGRPVTMLTYYNEPKNWGQIDSNYYVLDTSNPEALDFVGNVFRTLRGWGFTMFKTDFMRWNMHDTSKVRRYDPKLTSVEIFRNTLQVIREAIGEESYWLGCIAPFLPFIGYADGMRIAGDVGAQWEENNYGPVNMIREIAADNYFNHIYWQNDPDSVILRDFDVHLLPHEIRTVALLQAVSGGVITTSDPIHRLPEERKRLLHFIRPRGEHVPEIPFLKEERRDLVMIHKSGKGNLLFAMNPTAETVTVLYDLRGLFGERKWHVREYGGADRGQMEQYLAVLKPHESLLLFVTPDPLDAEPDNLWEVL